MVFVDDTNLWSRLEDDDDLLSATQIGQEGVNLWAGFLQEVGGMLQPPKCAWTIHDMQQDEKGKWGYRDAEKKKGKGKDRYREEDACNHKMNGPEITVPQLKGDAKAVRTAPQIERGGWKPGTLHQARWVQRQLYVPDERQDGRQDGASKKWCTADKLDIDQS